MSDMDVAITALSQCLSDGLAIARYIAERAKRAEEHEGWKQNVDEIRRRAQSISGSMGALPKKH